MKNRKHPILLLIRFKVCFFYFMHVPSLYKYLPTFAD